MHHHDPEFRFCPVCGGRLESRRLKENEPDRLVCLDCGFVFYLDPKLVACTIVEIGEGILLVKRDIQPQKGKWVIPGGYVDRGEEVHRAAIRETQEECGIDITIERLLGIYSYPGRMQVVVVYIGRPINGIPVAGEETSEVRVYSLEDIPWSQLAFQSTVDALKDYIRSKEE
ncbi:MAG: NUDIX hydrolase [Deltaproteobacteria bacterium]|nr:MAG: NUDIX hydrolase [Deltaproteobacteria bacterium]